MLSADRGRIYLGALLAIYLLTLFFVNPYVRGDGVGYYAYARSLLIDGDLHFENEFARGNQTFRDALIGPDGRVFEHARTETGRVRNHFSVGPAMLWLPFLALTHLGVLACNLAGWGIPADGFSKPYMLTMALATTGYGFAGLLLAYSLARRYVDALWAFLAVLGIWFGSSLPFYMYFNPSWSHAHSAFTVALFLWYWLGTKESRSWGRWMAAGLLGGLMVNIYYPNAVLLLLPLAEGLRRAWRILRGGAFDRAAFSRLVLVNAAFLTGFLLALIPTLATRALIYGSVFRHGYPGLGEWHWTSPVFHQVLFSSNHGLFWWTPLLLPATAGLVLLLRRDRVLGLQLLLVFAAYLYLIASYRTWHGLSSYGNRFFVSLTALFVIGLALLLSRLAGWIGSPGRAVAVGAPVLAAFVLWNLGLIYQYGTLMVPSQGPVSWRQVAHNQIRAVPRRVFGDMQQYLLRRSEMMETIETREVEQLRRRSEGK